MTDLQTLLCCLLIVGGGMTLTVIALAKWLHRTLAKTTSILSDNLTSK